MAELRGIVINVHGHGATVRLEDGGLAAVPLPELNARRMLYTRSHERRAPIELELLTGERRARHRTVRAAGSLEPLPSGEPVVLTDDAFEARMADYLRSTQEWAPADRPQPFERHFLRKKRRAAYFNGGT